MTEWAPANDWIRNSRRTGLLRGVTISMIVSWLFANSILAISQILDRLALSSSPPLANYQGWLVALPLLALTGWVARHLRRHWLLNLFDSDRTRFGLAIAFEWGTVAALIAVVSLMPTGWLQFGLLAIGLSAVGTFWWQSGFVRFRQSRFATPSTMANNVHSEWGEASSSDEPLDQNCIMQIKVCTDGNTHSIEGTVRIPFDAGQTAQSAHVLFHPPFDVVPQVDMEQVDGPNANVKIGQQLPQGVRLDARIEKPTEPVSVVVAFFATPYNSELS
ncbi:MAG: hypothetical protein KDA87_26410 [Planctomycetales bacterium]|nr:hypothetical protein [Planctomycetales bacterium]